MINCFMLRGTAAFIVFTAGAILLSADPPLLSPRQRQASATMAADYLCRILDREGRFVYSFNPHTNAPAVTYNWLRHAGTIIALAQTYRVSREEKYRRAAVAAAAALKRQIRKVTIDGITYEVLVSDPDTTGARYPRQVTVKTGGCALAAIALLEVDQITGRQDHKGLVLKQCHYLRRTQMPNGDLRSKFLVDTGKWSDFKSDYYAGEALVALARVQATYPVHQNRQAMIRLFAFLLRGWQFANQMARHRGMPFDHWGMIGALNVLPQLQETDFGEWLGPGKKVTTDSILDLLIRYCQNELDRQLRSPRAAGTAGSFRARPGALTPTAIRLEGITAVANLVRSMGTAAQKQQVAQWAAGIDRARRFMILCQYTGGEKFDRPLKIDITGGFRQAYDLKRKSAAEIRIDNCQHAISGLLEWSPPNLERGP